MAQTATEKPKAPSDGAEKLKRNGAASEISGAHAPPADLTVEQRERLTLGPTRFLTKTRSTDREFCAQVLAMVVLGPVPAVAMSVLVAILICVGRGLRPSAWLNNLAAFAVFPLVGGVLTQLVIGDVHDKANQLAQGPMFALVVFGVFLIANALNFLVIALDNFFLENQPLMSQIRETFTPMLPGQTAAARSSWPRRRSPGCSPLPTPTSACQSSSRRFWSWRSSSTCSSRCCVRRTAPTSWKRALCTSPRCSSASSPRSSRRLPCATA